MFTTRHFQFAAALLLVVLTGCTHIQLRKNATNEAVGVGVLQQQQVLDNLAMFVHDYNSMPYFAYPNQGAAIVTDQGSGSINAGFSRPITSSTFNSGQFFRPPFFLSFLLSSMGLSGSAQRSC